MGNTFISETDEVSEATSDVFACLFSVKCFPQKPYRRDEKASTEGFQLDKWKKK